MKYNADGTSDQISQERWMNSHNAGIGLAWRGLAITKGRSGALYANDWVSGKGAPEEVVTEQSGASQRKESASSVGLGRTWKHEES